MFTSAHELSQTESSIKLTIINLYITCLNREGKRYCSQHSIHISIYGERERVSVRKSCQTKTLVSWSFLMPFFLCQVSMTLAAGRNGSTMWGPGVLEWMWQAARSDWCSSEERKPRNTEKPLPREEKNSSNSHHFASILLLSFIFTCPPPYYHHPHWFCQSLSTLIIIRYLGIHLMQKELHSYPLTSRAIQNMAFHRQP